MGDVKGIDGQLQYSSTGVAVAGIDTWELTGGARKDEVTAYGDSFEEWLQTMKFATCNFSGTMQSSDASADAIMDMFETGGTLASIYLHLVYTTKWEFLGKWVVDEYNLSGGVKDAKKFRGSATLTGGITRSTI